MNMSSGFPITLIITGSPLLTVSACSSSLLSDISSSDGSFENLSHTEVNCADKCLLLG